MTETVKIPQIGDRVIVNQTSGFHKGATGVVSFVEPQARLGEQDGRVWVFRDGSNRDVYFHLRELDIQGPTSKPLDKWDHRFLRLAREVASWSKDPSTKVGAVLVSPDKLKVAIGYNGFPRDMADTPELYSNREEKYSRIIHGEKNAKNNALRMGVMDLNGWTLYTWPFASCDRCFVEIADSGVQRFVAPKVPKELAERWEPILSKTRQYALEMGRTLEEVDFPTTFPKEEQ